MMEETSRAADCVRAFRNSRRTGQEGDEEEMLVKAINGHQRRQDRTGGIDAASGRGYRVAGILQVVWVHSGGQK